jgi:hypothetical protein
LDGFFGTTEATEKGYKNKILEWIMRKENEKLLNGFIWLRIGTSDGLL